MSRVATRTFGPVAVAVTLVVGLSACAGADGTGGERNAGDAAAEDVTTTLPRPPAETLEMRKLKTISGEISPKSVVASGHGVVTAQNMMYTHTVTAYDVDGNLLATVSDSVTLTDFGIDEPGEFKGAPVEAAFMPGGKAVYVSNYSMYGPGHSEGLDSCVTGDGTTTSFLYRISTETWAIDQVVPAGAVPKYVAVTPDGKEVLASNWCSGDLGIASTETGQVLRSVPIGSHPRGIAITPDSATAYVTVMGGTDLARVDIDTGSVSWIRGVGMGPRHVVMAPDGSALYVSLNRAGTVVKIDPVTGKVLARVATGVQPRSAAISTDGTALYVVNYESSTVSKIRTSDMEVLATVTAGYHPIGITYDDATGRVWVANYGGTIDIWDEVPAS